MGRWRQMSINVKEEMVDGEFGVWLCYHCCHPALAFSKNVWWNYLFICSFSYLYTYLFVLRNSKTQDSSFYPLLTKIQYETCTGVHTDADTERRWQEALVWRSSGVARLRYAEPPPSLLIRIWWRFEMPFFRRRDSLWLSSAVAHCAVFQLLRRRNDHLRFKGSPIGRFDSSSSMDKKWNSLD